MNRFTWYHTTRNLLTSCFIQVSDIHCSSTCLKKTKFYNQYIKEYRPRIDNSYVESHLQKVLKKSTINFESDEPDFKALLLKEGKRRSDAFHRKKWKAERTEKKSIPHVFTSDQMQHIRFLRNQNPELWTLSYLSKSFGVEPDVIYKVLKSKPKQSDEEIQAHDEEIDRYRNKAALMKVDQGDVSASLSTKVVLPPTRKLEEEVKNNPWFKPFDKSSEELELELKHKDEIEEIMEEESYSDEHYELFNVDEEEEDIELEDEEDIMLDDDDKLTDECDQTEAKDEELVVKSDDNINFYDNEGRFLYKVR